jgi:uncharacterized protein (TIGR02246 family)
MTAEQKYLIEADIQRLLTLYANLNDLRDWQQVASLYTPDGVMIRPVAGTAPVNGREAILASFMARPTDRRTKHVYCNGAVQVLSPTTATAYSAYVIYYGTQDDSHPLPLLDKTPPILCEFNDALLLTAEGWRFTRRNGQALFRLA